MVGKTLIIFKAEKEAKLKAEKEAKLKAEKVGLSGGHDVDFEIQLGLETQQLGMHIYWGISNNLASLRSFCMNTILAN